MPNVKTLGEWSTEITPAQREKALALIGKTRTLGNVAALRTAGVVGSGAHIRTLVVQSGFYDDAAVARGWDLVAVENSTWLVAQDPEHSHWDRANARVLKAYHPLYREQAQLEVSGRMEVSSPDVAAAIERFTSTILRLASRGGEDEAAGAAIRAGHSPPRLPMGGMASPPEPSTA